MSSTKPNQEIARKLQSLMKGFGYEAKLGHAYEILSQLNGEASWNVASAKESNLSGGLQKRQDVDDLFRKQTVKLGDPVTGMTAYTCSLTAGATVRFDTTIYAATEADARGAFLKAIQEGRVRDVEVVEPPVIKHDFNPEDIETEADSQLDYSRLVRTPNGIQSRVPGASARIGSGKSTFEAKIVTQAAEAKIYVEIKADSEDEARKMLTAWMDKTDLTSPPMMQIAVRDGEVVPELTDWQVIHIDQPEIQHIQKV